MLYLLDANVLIDSNRDYYPIGRVPEFWDWLVHMGGQGQVKVSREVYESLTEDKNDIIANWLKANRDTMLFEEPIEGALLERVVNQGYGADLTDVEIEKLNEDPFLIACALADPTRRYVVTNEASRPARRRHNRHIPDVCRDLEVRCINTFELIRQLDFSTDWRTL